MTQAKQGRLEAPCVETPCSTAWQGASTEFLECLLSLHAEYRDVRMRMSKYRSLCCQYSLQRRSAYASCR